MPPRATCTAGAGPSRHTNGLLTCWPHGTSLAHDWPYPAGGASTLGGVGNAVGVAVAELVAVAVAVEVAVGVEAGVALSDAISIVGLVLAPRRIAVTGSGLRAFRLMEDSFRSSLAHAFAPGLVPERDVVFVPGGTERITAGMAHLALEAVDMDLANRPDRAMRSAAG